MASLGTLVPASPLDSNDSTRLIFTVDINETLSRALADMPSDFATMDDLSWQVDYRQQGVSDDTLSLGIRIVNGATILAAADSGGTFQSVDANVTNTTDTLSSVTAFTYVNTTASKADWDGASVELDQVYTKLKGADSCSIEVDYVAITGNYTVDSGTRAATLNETLGTLTVSGIGSVDIEGDLTKTLDAVTVSSTTDVIVGGALTESLDNVTVSSDGEVTVSGDTNETLDDVAVSSTGTVDIEGTLNEALDDVTVSSEGSVDLIADAIFSLDDVGVSSVVDVLVVGNTVETLDALTVSSDGVVEDPPAVDPFKGGIGDISLGYVAFGGGAKNLSQDSTLFIDFVATLGDVTLASDTVVDVSGTLSKTLDTIVLSSAASVDVVADASNTLGDVTVSSDTSVSVAGTVNTTLDTVALASDASVSVQADTNATLDALSLSSATSIQITADAGNTLADLTLSSDGVVLPLAFATLSVTLDGVTLSSAGTAKVGSGGFYQAAVTPGNNPYEGQGFYNNDSGAAGSGVGFNNPHSENAGSDGGFYN